MSNPFRIRLCRVVFLQLLVAVLLLGVSTRSIAQGYLTLPTVGDFPISCGFGCYTGHGGTDFSTGTTGKDIVAAADGTVIFASDTDAPNDPSIAWPNTFGNYIKIDHGTIDGQRIVTFYAHLLHGSFMVNNGAKVLRGQQIGASGNSGTSDGPHLHFEIRADGVSKDPFNTASYLWTSNPPVHSTYIPAQGLIQLAGNGTIYWLQNGIIYPVSGPSIINDMESAGIANWAWGKVVTVPSIASYTTGPSILTATSTSNNLLVRDESTTRIYKMNNGVKEYQSTVASHADVIHMAQSFFVSETNATFTVGQSATTEPIRQVFLSTYTANSANLGLPTDVVKPTTSYTGFYQTFDKGSLQYTASGANAGSAFAVYGEIYDKWADLHYDSSPLGLPTGNQSEPFISSQGTTGCYQSFEGGTIQVNTNIKDNIKYAFAVYGKIYEKWGQLSYAAGTLGLPTGDMIGNVQSGFGTSGSYQRFENGTIQVIGANAYAVSGSIYGEWGKHGYAGIFTPGDDTEIAHATWAGFPVSDAYTWSGKTRQDFEGGYIQYSGMTAEFVSDKHPQSLTAAVQTGNTIHLAWQNRITTAGVNVYRSGSPTELIATVAGSATSYTDTTAAAGHAYTYFITAYNETAESPASNLASMSIAGTDQNVLTVLKAGLGSGMVTSSDGLIDCGYDCSEVYDGSSTVTLTAQPGPTSTFAGWSGACTGTSVTCTCSFSTAENVTAIFNNHLIATPPDAPSIGTATAGQGQATVTFTAPAFDGESPIFGYTVTSSPGGKTASSSSSPITVDGLTNGTTYTFTVTASNAAGISTASAASNSVIPSIEKIFLTDTDVSSATSWTTAYELPYLDEEINVGFAGQTATATWYSMHLTANQGITITLSPHINSSSLSIYLYDVNGTTQLSSSTLIYNGETVALSYKVNTSGVYYIKIVGGSSVVGNYDLAVYNAWFNPGVTDNQRNFNSTINTAKYIQDGTYSVGPLNKYYRFTAIAGQEIAVTLKPFLNSGSLSMYLYNADGTTQIGSKTLIYNGENETLSKIVAATGVYYLKVTGGASITGSYELGISGINIDQDSDGFSDNLDNCPNTANPGQEDADHDGVGDVCDTCPGYDDKVDVDGNGTPDYCQDSDNDLISDGWERDHGMNPYANDLIADTDHDGVVDALEDPDNDGYSTLREVLSGTNPLPPYGNTDSPFDVNPGFSDLDKDGDMDGLDLSGCSLEFHRTDCDSLLPCRCDLDNNGKVDKIDLQLFLEDYPRIY